MATEGGRKWEEEENEYKHGLRENQKWNGDSTYGQSLGKLSICAYTCVHVHTKPFMFLSYTTESSVRVGRMNTQRVLTGSLVPCAGLGTLLS